MIRYAITIIILYILYLAALSISAQDVPSTTKRRFDEKLILRIDLDGNGIRDRIVSHRYTRKVKSPTDEKAADQFVEGHFIQFNWQKDSAKSSLKMFSYQYGASDSYYWVYELEPIGDMNNDGTTDLWFYAGDDTSKEVVFLLSKNGFFKAVYAGNSTLSLDVDWADSGRSIIDAVTKQELGRWNPKRELFEGNRIRWVRKDRVQVRAESSTASKALSQLWRGEVVKLVSPQKNEPTKREWTFINTGSHQGWVETAHLSTSSVSHRIFK